MTAFLTRLFFHNWKQKLVAIIAAMITWMFVNQSITDTKTISGVPVRIINLPADKTIRGILPNGIQGKRISLTLNGTKDVIQDLEPGDLEVLIDASNYDSDEWIVKLTKKQLVSLNPSIDIAHHVTQVDHAEFIIKLSPLVTAKIPIHVEVAGSVPEGYQFLDVWPETLMQTVSGPEEEIEKLKDKGLELTFDLDAITGENLDELKTTTRSTHDDEVSFLVPNKWKQVSIPFQHHSLEQVNDPEATNLRIDFLRQEMLAIDADIPIRVFFPIKWRDTLNPATLSIAPNEWIQEANGLFQFAYPLYVRQVSRLFLSIIRDNIEIVIIAAPTSEREELHWNVEVFDPKELEDTYVAYLIGNLDTDNAGQQQTSLVRKREELLRKRFRDYAQKLRLYINPKQKLQLRSMIVDDKIKISTNIPHKG